MKTASTTRFGVRAGRNGSIRKLAVTGAIVAQRRTPPVSAKIVVGRDDFGARAACPRVPRRCRELADKLSALLRLRLGRAAIYRQLWDAPARNSQHELAFTLPEMMISMSILTLVLAGVLSSHLFGVRLLELTKAKLGASGEARKAVGNLSSEIRSAKWIQIGAGNSSSFTEVTDGLAQQGSAVQIYASMNTNSYVRYFLETNGQRLMRVTSAGGSSTLVANCITNSQVFTSEDFAGNILTNNQNNRVIGLVLQFYQIQYPIIQIGPGNYYDYYQLRTRITRRTLE